MTPVAKTEQCNISQGSPSSQPKSYGVIEMMQMQIQQQAFEYQCDQEEKAELEKHQLEELKEEHEECRLERQQHQQAIMMMFMAMHRGDVSNINLKSDNQSD
jgi:hypothetical protein